MRKHLGVPLVVFFLALSLGAGVTSIVYRQESLRREQELERILREVTAGIGDRLAQAQMALSSAAAFIETRQLIELPRERFANYVHSLLKHDMLRGVRGIGLIETATPENIAQIEARLQRDYGQSFNIAPLDGTRPHAIIMMLEPANDRGLGAIGYDVTTEPERHAALSEAKLTGRVAMTSPLVLVQSDEHAVILGTLLYLHLSSARPEAPERYVYVPLRLDTLINTLPHKDKLSAMAVRITDSDAGGAFLYQSDQFDDHLAAHELVATSSIEFAGRHWQIEGSVRSELGPIGRWPATKVFAFGAISMALTLALAAQALQAALRNGRALQRAQAASLKAKDLHLREMSHRLKNVLARVTAMSRQAARYSSTKEDFVQVLEDRLMAMSKAQDMLTRSSHGCVDLRKLIEAELGQVYSDEVKDLRLTGPSVNLTADQTQPFGLAIHELATNALKYGAASQSTGSLYLHWEVLEGPSSPLLRLQWEEHSNLLPPQTPRRGFGTQLIDSCIRMELSGQIERGFSATGLHVTIRIPLSREQADGALETQAA